MPRTTKKTTAPIEKHTIPTVPVAEQPYQVPENWRWVRLGDVAHWGSGGTPSRKHPEYYSGHIPWIKTGELNDDYIFDSEECITEEAIHDSSAKLFPINSVVIAMYGATIGKVGILGINATTNQACACGICSTKLFYKYLFYYARFQKDVFIGLGKGGAQPNISQEIIKNHPIPLPPLAEQQRIVDRIERLFAKLDEAREKAQAVVDGFENRKAAILHQAFTGELTRKWREERGIGMDSWKHQCLKACCSIGSGGTPSRKEIEYYNGTIPWIKTGEIEWNDIFDSEEHISQLGIDNSSAKIYKEGVVLVAMYGMGVTRGRAAILRVKAATNQAVCVLDPKAYLSNKYLFYYFMCNYWNIRQYAVGGNQLNLSATIISKFKIQIPTIDEQYRIISLLDNLFAQEQRARDLAESVIAQIDGMKKAILARAFRGELGTNDPSEAACEG